MSLRNNFSTVKISQLLQLSCTSVELVSGLLCEFKSAYSRSMYFVGILAWSETPKENEGLRLGSRGGHAVIDLKLKVGVGWVSNLYSIQSQNILQVDRFPPWMTIDAILEYPFEGHETDPERPT